MSYYTVNIIRTSSLCIIILCSLIANEDALPIHARKINTVNVTTLVSDNVNSEQTSSSSLIDMYKKTENSVVQITSQPNATASVIRQNALISKTTGFGSGFVYDSQGHIITNGHIVEGNKEITYVKFANGNIYTANIIGIDSYSDLAVLQIAQNFSNERLIPLKLGNSSLLQVGQQVAAIGNPFGIQNLMTEGIISGLNLLLPNNQTGFSIPDVIVTDVPLNPGNSGGPLLNSKGEVIGINTAIAYSNQFSELSYSISSNIIKKIVPELIAYGRYSHPWLGVTASSLPIPNIEHGAESPINYKGVVITSLQPGSPAARAKLQPATAKHIGDIIIAIDGHPVNRFEDIINYIESTKAIGETITLELVRNGTNQNVSIKLAEIPNLISVNAAEQNKKITTATGPMRSRLAIDKNWTKIIDLSNSNISSQGARLAASGNNVYVVWEESQYSGIDRIMFSKSTDRGDTFSKPSNLTSAVKIDSETASIGASRKKVYVVWADDSPGNYDIFFIRSTDYGNTFSKPVNLSDNPGVSYFPKLATDGNNGIYIVWTDNSLGNYNIEFTKSIDGGATFNRPIILSNDTRGVSNFPNMAISGNNNVYITWSHKNNTDFDPSNTTNQTQTYDVFLTKSKDGGNTFSKPVNLSSDPSNSQSPAVAVSQNNNVYVVWTDNSIGTYEIFLTKSKDGGNTFSKVIVISSNVARSISPSISTYGNNIYIVWSDNTFGNSEIVFTQSTDNGSTFDMPININNDTWTSDLAQIMSAPGGGNGGDLYLVWQDIITGHTVIYFTKKDYLIS
jgi:S1-C subfamily serine protease